ncbi:MAG: gliding motility protein GldM [Tannerellaceae bacterium]|jgi:gliding motility-associated protein GldM|nr:gliding motility protein GldM [Tannerellaceae bacterium]
MAIGNNPNSPRQKMINLMYLVFIALMALNVSSEVLDGFALVENSLNQTIDNAQKRNEIVNREMADYYASNPDKVKEWYEKGIRVGAESEQLFNYVQDLKERIARTADGKNADANNIVHKDDLEAASRIMLAPINGEGVRLREAIVSYRSMMAGMVLDSTKKRVIRESLGTEPHTPGRNWEESLFENMPVAAAMTLLTKLQSDIRYVQGEVMSNLLSSVDVKDYRVNKLEAQIVPKSQIVMQGSSYEANIVLSAVDTTKRPEIWVNDVQLAAADSGRFVTRTGAVGTFPLNVAIRLPGSDGTTQTYTASTNYFVTAPVATVAPTMMNVLYAGIDNPIEIAMSGIPSGNISASSSDAGVRLTPQGSLWVALPSAGSVGKEVEVVVSARMADGSSQRVSGRKFRIKMLPDPMPYLEYKDAGGNVRSFRGGTITKRDLMQADGILAAIDDGILSIRFSVLRFELTYPDSFGNMLRETVEGSNFSERQKNYIRNLPRGKQFWINNVTAKGPDGIERKISPIQVIVNQ